MSLDDVLDALGAAATLGHAGAAVTLADLLLEGARRDASLHIRALM